MDRGHPAGAHHLGNGAVGSGTVNGPAPDTGPTPQRAAEKWWNDEWERQQAERETQQRGRGGIDL